MANPLLPWGWFASLPRDPLVEGKRPLSISPRSSGRALSPPPPVVHPSISSHMGKWVDPGRRIRRIPVDGTVLLTSHFPTHYWHPPWPRMSFHCIPSYPGGYEPIGKLVVDSEGVHSMLFYLAHICNVQNWCGLDEFGVVSSPCIPPVLDHDVPMIEMCVLMLTLTVSVDMVVVQTSYSISLIFLSRSTFWRVAVVIAIR